MNRKRVLAILALVLLPAGLAPSRAAGPSKGEPKFKAIAVKHFTLAEGVELSPEFPDFLYAELKDELKKSGLYEEITGEGEVVEANDAPKSLVVEGRMLEYKKGSVVKESLIGFGAGMRSLRAQITVRRRSDNEVVLDKELKVRASSKWDEKVLAKFLAKKVSGELKGSLAH